MSQASRRNPKPQGLTLSLDPDEIEKDLEEQYRQFEPYFEERGRFRLDPEGRATKHTHWDESEDANTWTISQVLSDYEGLNDWEAVFTVSLPESRQENRAVVKFVEVRAIGAS